MKVIKKEAILSFKPFSITITFESQEEVDAVVSMVQYGHSIPDNVCVWEDETNGKNYMTRFLTSIHQAIKE